MGSDAGKVAIAKNTSGQNGDSDQRGNNGWQGNGVAYVGLILLVLAFWLMGEAVAAVLRFRGKKPVETMRVEFE